MCLAVIKERRTLHSMEIEFTGGIEWRARSQFQVKLRRLLTVS